MFRTALAITYCCCLVVACDRSPVVVVDAATDTGRAADGGPVDAPPPDSPSSDSARPDARSADSIRVDSTVDRGLVADRSLADRSLADHSLADRSLADRGPADRGPADARPTDGGPRSCVPKLGVDAGFVTPAGCPRTVWAIALPLTITPRVAVDSLGNAYVADSFSGTIATPKGNVASKGSNDVAIFQVTSSGTIGWTVTGGGSAEDFAQGVAVHPSTREVFVAGSFVGAATLGAAAMKPAAGASGRQAYLGRIDTTGKVAAVTVPSVTGKSEGTSVAIDTTGNVYFGGNINGDVAIGTAKASAKGAASDFTAFVAKMTRTGTGIWARALTGGKTWSVLHLGVDTKGVVSAAGIFKGATKIATKSFTAKGTIDYWAGGLSPTGAETWGVGAGGTPASGALDVDWLNDATADPAGNSYIAGLFNGGGTTTHGSTTHTGRGAGQLFLGKLDNKGAFAWSRAIGSTSTRDGQGDRAQSVAVDSKGNLYLAGVYTATTAFDAISLTNSGSEPHEAFVAKVDAKTGKFVWVLPIPATVASLTFDIAVGPAGNLYITGSTFGSAALGSKTLPRSTGFLWKLTPP